MAITQKNGVWYAVIYYRDILGKQKRKWIKASSQKDAERIERNARTDQERGSISFSRNVKLPEVADRWLDTFIKPNKRPGTITNYESLLKTINAEMGNLNVNKITNEHIQTFINLLAKNGKSKSSMRISKMILSQIFDACIHWKIITVNPVVAIVTPQVRTINEQQANKTNALTPDAVLKLIDAVSGTVIETAVYLGVFCGLRRGEVCGLTWDNVKSNERIMEIKQQYIRNHITKKTELVPVKTIGSLGVIPIPKIIAMQFEVERQRQEANKRIAKDSYHKGNYVCCWEDGRPLEPDFLYHKLKKIIAAYNNEKEPSEKIPSIRFHDLRHTNATLLFKAGIEAKLISAQLRHIDYRFTQQRYVHVLDDMKVETADAIDGIFLQQPSLENSLERQKDPVK